MQPIFQNIVVEFGVEDTVHIPSPQTDALMIAAEIGGYNVERVFVYTGSSVDIIFMDYFRKMRSIVTVDLVGTSLFVFIGEVVRVAGKIELHMVLGEGTLTQMRTIMSMLVDALSQYKVILGRPSLSLYATIISPAHLMMKFPVEEEKRRVVGVEVVHGDPQASRTLENHNLLENRGVGG